LAMMSLVGRADEPTRKLSGGMKRRLNVSLGMVHSPRVLLLDEPTAGVDPQARLNMLEVIRKFAEDGAAVLYTTHYMDEAELLCDRIAVIDQGRILAEGTLEELQSMIQGEEIITLSGSFDVAAVGRYLERTEGVNVISTRPSSMVIAISGASGEGRARKLLAEMFSRKLAIDSFSIEPPGLNWVFLKLTGRELRD